MHMKMIIQHSFINHSSGYQNLSEVVENIGTDEASFWLKKLHSLDIYYHTRELPGVALVALFHIFSQSFKLNC